MWGPPTSLLRGPRKTHLLIRGMVAMWHFQTEELDKHRQPPQSNPKVALTLSPYTVYLLTIV